MKRWLKWLGLGLAVLLVLGVIAGGIVYSLIARTVQPLSGEMSIAGLSAPVDVVRDENGVPHIEAQTRADAAAALGFSHAQDRLWQMHMLRMTGQGRLSELFGKSEDVQDIDIFLRSLGFLDQARSSLDVLNEESRQLLDAYASGVNAYLNQRSRLLSPKLPPEFLILGVTPEAWKPEHSLVVLKVMALQLSKNMGREVDRLALAAKGLTPAEIMDILPPHENEVATPLPTLSDYFTLTEPFETTSNKIDSDFASAFEDGLGVWASNNWVLDGTRTDTGKPLLANDPHLGFNAPGLWYLAHMRWKEPNGETINTVGATIPAVPAIVLGRSDHIAWGFTNAGGDVQDLYVERLRLGDKNQYMTPGGWKQFEEKEETVNIKGSDPITFKRRVTRHGPILPRTFRDYGKYLTKDLHLALEWTGLSESDRSFEILSGVARAKTVQQFVGQLNGTIAPMQSIVIADTRGTIGWSAQAALPIRSPANPMQGRAPVPGWVKTFDWQGLASPYAMPSRINPQNGAIGTANSRFENISDKPLLTHDWDESYRHVRVQQTMVNANGKLGVADMKKGQNDAYSPAMVEFRDILLDVMDQRPKRSRVISRLREWNGDMDASRPEPLILTAIFRHALEVIYKDDLGPVFNVAHATPAKSLSRILVQGGSRNWCDETTTNGQETCGFALAKAFDLALAELEGTLGENWRNWKWGDLHVAGHEHQPFGKIALLAKFFDVERPMSGGAYTLLRAKTKFATKRPYRATHGAGYRAIYDFSDLEKSLYSITTGQSGNVFSDRYDDQADRWAAGDYIAVPTDKTVYSKSALGSWSLTPVE